MDVEAIASLIKEVGFPIAVAWFVLVRLNGKMDKVTDAINRLIQTLEQQHSRAELDHLQDRSLQERILDRLRKESKND